MHVLIIYTENLNKWSNRRYFSIASGKSFERPNIKVGILNPNIISPRYFFKDYSNIKNKYIEIFQYLDFIKIFFQEK